MANHHTATTTSKIQKISRRRSVVSICMNMIATQRQQQRWRCRRHVVLSSIVAIVALATTTAATLLFGMTILRTNNIHGNHNSNNKYDTSIIFGRNIPSISIIHAFHISTTSHITAAQRQSSVQRSIMSSPSSSFICRRRQEQVPPHHHHHHHHSFRQEYYRNQPSNDWRMSSSSSSSSQLCMVSQSPSLDTISNDDDRNNNNNNNSNNEWHPNDPAFTTPQLLEGIWSQIASAKNMARHESYTVIYPQMEASFQKPRFLNVLFAHLDACKDVCDHFGITTTLQPYKQKGRVVGFTVQSFRNPDIAETTTAATTSTKSRTSSSSESSPDSTSNDDSNDNEMKFEYDPFWDDGTDFAALYDGIDDDDMVPDPYPMIENKIPDHDETIIDITKSWVGSVMSDMGVCPFTQGADKAGLPLGDVYYTVDRSSGFEDMYERYWKEVTRIEQNPEKDVSTVLLITPEFCMDNLELFESFTNTLTQPLTALGIEDLIQLVFFHPVWSFRDGDARSSPSGQAANYARRSPWPMINLLRTTQVRTAQKGIPTGLVYKQNEKTLARVGVDKLETMLRLRDWTDTGEFKVDRSEHDALKIAQKFQKTGQLSEEDTSLRHDATPAANKVDRRHVEEGNLVNVLLQALEKRLDMGISTLTGPETSATALATDVLIDKLEDLLSVPTTAESSTATVVAATTTTTEMIPQIQQSSITGSTNTSTTSTDGMNFTDEIARARQARMDAARRSIMEDLIGDANDRSGSSTNIASTKATSTDAPLIDPMDEVLFGRGGISDKKSDEEDDLFIKGLNPDSFF